MGYVYVDNGSQTSRFQLTSTAPEPRLRAGTGYVPLVMGSTTGPQLKCQMTPGGVLRAGVYTSTLTKSTKTEVGYSTVGNAGTRTTQTANYNSSAAAKGAMSNTTALTCYSTTAYAGSSSRSSGYNTSSVNVGNLSYTTALTKWGVVYSYSTTTEEWYTHRVTTGVTYHTYTQTAGEGVGNPITWTHVYTWTGTNGTTYGVSTETDTWTANTTINHYGNCTTAYSGVSSQRSDYYIEQPSAAGIWNTTALIGVCITGYSGVSSSTYTQSSTQNRSSYYTSSYSEASSSSWSVQTSYTSTSSQETTTQTSSLTSGNGYRIVGGAIVADQAGYSSYSTTSVTTSSYTSTSHGALSATTTTQRTSTYSRTSQASYSYGAQNSQITFVKTVTYYNTTWMYL